MDKVIEKLSNFTGVDKEVLNKAIEEKNADALNFDGLVVKKESDIESIKKNAIRDAKGLHNKDFNANVIKAAGLEGDFNNITSILSAYKENVLKSAKIEPNKQIQDLQSQLETVRNTITGKDKEIANISGLREKDRLNYYIESKLPRKLANGLERKEAAALLQMGIGIEKENGKYYPVENGQKKQDDNGNFIELGSYLDNKIEQRGWNAQQETNDGGKGEGHRTNTNSSVNSIEDCRNIDDVNKYMKKNNIKVGSAQASQLLTKAAQNKDFKFE